MSAISRLMGTHLNLHCNRRLPFLTDLDLLVISFDRSSVDSVSVIPNYSSYLSTYTLPILMISFTPVTEFVLTAAIGVCILKFP